VAIVVAGLACCVAAQVMGAPAGEGVIVGALVSMSSTAVVLQCLAASGQLAALAGQVTVGTLIVQDCTIGLLFALLPPCAGRGGAAEALAAVARVAAAAAAFAAAAALAGRRVVPGLMGWAAARGAEMHQLTALALCLALSKASDAAGLSLELGAFVAGVMVAAGGEGHMGERTLAAVEPVRNVFAALFLASIGLLLHPAFLWQHAAPLLLCVALVLLAKGAVVALVVRAFGYDARTAAATGLALAQVGEFSFALLAKASALRLVQRPVYLLLLGTTALSLLATPLLFRAHPALTRAAAAGAAEPEEEARDGRGAEGSPAEGHGVAEVALAVPVRRGGGEALHSTEPVSPVARRAKGS
jgi:predicted Kef-type K+ transport protein